MKKLYFLLGFATICEVTFAQSLESLDKTRDVLPPAPNAASIINYANASINKNTGAPSINIPLFSLKGNKLSTSVSLGYSSNGLKVDEIASRVGMGWALNAGGVITRTVRGVPDMANARHYPDGNWGWSWSLYMKLKRLAESPVKHGYDAEPDLFNYSFDGHSGSFIIDFKDKPKLIGKNGFKIDMDLQSTISNFTITTTEGIMYVFGGSGATEETKRETDCSRTYAYYTPNAWYLKEIVHPNGEKIIFSYSAHSYTYDNGVTQTMYSPRETVAGCNSYNPSTLCTNITKTNGVLLNSISSPGNGSISFIYTSREDCTDQLVSFIKLNDATSVKRLFILDYMNTASNATYNSTMSTNYSGTAKTPYLISLSESSPDYLQLRKHTFSYIDPGGRPSRLSFSQDHWGYFNGKLNGSLVPTTDYGWPQEFPLADGDRNPDPFFAKKGLLEKVVYPTGGLSRLFYEPNVYHGTPESYSTRHQVSCDVTGTGSITQVSKTQYFTIDHGQVITIFYECKDNTGGSGPYTQQVGGLIDIYEVSTNSLKYTGGALPGFNHNEQVQLVYPGQYKLVISGKGQVSTMYSKIDYEPENITYPTTLIGAGLRIQRLATGLPNETPIVKRYYYGTVEDLNTSSLTNFAIPQYLSITSKIGPCTEGNPGGSYVFSYNTLNSSSQYSLEHFNNNAISYNSVVESFGDNFENGGIESKFYTMYDGQGTVVFGNRFLNAPKHNFSYAPNGKIQKETVLKKMTNGVLKPIKVTEYTYNHTSPVTEDVISGYAVAQGINYKDFPLPYDTTCNIISSSECRFFLELSIQNYHVIEYKIFSTWTRPVSVTETVYDENGENPLTTTQQSYFANPEHYQLTSSETINSDGELIRNSFKYPHDYSTSPLIESMKALNKIAVPISSKSEIVKTPGNIILNENEVTYEDKGSNNILPVNTKKSIKGNALEVEAEMKLYDSKGNLLEYTDRSGVTSCIIWGYNYLYPVAQVVNSAYANAIAQLTVSVEALQTMDGTALLTELNRIRTGLSGAQVTSYSYKSMVGVSTITDANNRTSSFEYDAFNQLLIVKDQDGNIVKKNEYHYVNPNPNADINVYFNPTETRTIACNSCLPGYTGTSSSYTVPFGKYYSLTSLQDAQDQANADFLSLGQIHANKMALCSNTASCTGDAYKFLNCQCELGTKICLSTVPSGSGWIVQFKYQWSDGSTGPTYQETIASCSGVDKKMIGCNCETAIKVCESVVNNGAGSYTINFHYKWSDNSISTSYSENVTCTGEGKAMVGCECKTGFKIYTSTLSPGATGNTQCPTSYRCSYYYTWPGLAPSQTYYECSPTSCEDLEL